MLKIIDEQINTFYGKNYSITRIVRIFNNDGLYRVRVDQTDSYDDRGILKSHNLIKCNSLQEAQEKANYIIMTERYKIWE